MSTLTEEPTIESTDLNTDEGNSTPSQILMIEDIQKLLPHRYPFLLVDRIIEFVPNKSATGIKNVTFNEPFFQGHLDWECVALETAGLCHEARCPAQLAAPAKPQAQSPANPA